MDVGLLTDILTRLILGLGVGFAIGMTGIGSGVIAMPYLLYGVGLSPVSAVGTGLLYSTLTKVYGTYVHFRLRTIRKRTAFYIILGGAPAAFVASRVVLYLAGIYGSGLDYVLKIVISFVMLGTWGLMFAGFLKNRKTSSESYYAPPKRFPARRKIYGITAGLGLGVLAGSTSIGGGVLIIPILAAIFRLSPNNTVGTSVFIGVIISAVSSFVYFLGGNINLLVAMTLFIGSIPGIYLGSRTAVRLPHRVLSAILFVVVTASVIAMFAGLRR
ncbi:sulfite exporter TauE/SafE family protein [Candidatus Poribacteria bacterium]